MLDKFTYDYVYNYFKENGCELLEDNYINSHRKLLYKCVCGNISTIRFTNFKNGTRCRKCGRERTTQKQKLSYEYVKEQFEIHDCKLLETGYINAHIKMKYICECGNVSYITWNHFKSGKRCIKCKGTRAYKYETVKEYFKNYDCELLEIRYKDVFTKMKYRCSCGNISYIRFADFMKGQRCKKCGILKISGKNNYQWNENKTEKERLSNKIRSHIDKDFAKWSRDIKRRDCYTCQICGIRGGNLASHHLYNYADYPELRYDLDNGITIHVEEHDLFHSIYGKKNNNPDQFFMFKNNQIQNK